MIKKKLQLQIHFGSIFNYNIAILFLLLISTMVVIMGNIALSVLNTLIINDTKAKITKDQIGTMMFSSLICRMVAKLVAGSLVDSFNPKIILIASILLKEMFLIFFALSNEYVVMLIFWSLQDFCKPFSVKFLNNWTNLINITKYNIRQLIVHSLGSNMVCSFIWVYRKINLRFLLNLLTISFLKACVVEDCG